MLHFILNVSAFLMMFGCVSTSASDPVVFEYDGKSYRVTDLPETSKVEIFNLQKDHHDKMIEKARAAAIDLYVSELAKKEHKSHEQIESQLLNVNPNPSDEDLKSYYETVKTRVPFPFESIKGELAAFYLEEQKDQKRQALLAKIEKEKDVKLFIAAPVAPKFNIATAAFPSKGPKKAKIQLIEYADFTCPNCQQAVSDVKALLKKYPEQVEFVFKYYPLNKLEQAKNLARAGHCAATLGKFWEFHEYVYANQFKMAWQNPNSIATKLNFDMPKFEACYKSPESLAVVEQSYKEGSQIGVKATPTFFINGQQSISGNSFSALVKEIEARL
jgi:protein-disulfide isomerase